MIMRTLKMLLAALVLCSNAAVLHAQMAQDPLLARSSTVEPNIVFVFDDSGSMLASAIYQYGADSHGMGQSGPNNDGQSSGNWYNPPSPWGRSPDVNLIYYDPRVSYKRRVSADGTPMAQGSYDQNNDSFRVYFYKDSSTTYNVKSVSKGNSGIGLPATLTVTFPAPPAGGTQAKATATTRKVGIVSAITITDEGRYSRAPNVTITGGGGSGATATAYVNRRGRLTSITITNPGSGYTSRPTVSFSGGGGSGGGEARADIADTYVLDKITLTNAGSGYLVDVKNTMKINGQASGWKGATWSNDSNKVAGAVMNAKWNGTGNDPLQLSSFFASTTVSGGGSYTPDAASPLYPGAQVLPYPVTASKATAKYPKFVNRTDCAADHCTWLEELKNYANWKAYHSTRLELAKTGIGLAFQPLNPTFRLGWGRINKLYACDRWSCSYGNLDKGVRKFDSVVQKDFLDWLYAIDAEGGTPNRTALDRVGQYYQRADSNGPWADAPNGSGAITAAGTQSTHATCRRSYAMLMTDGYYNSEAVKPGDIDTKAGPKITNPTAYQYQPIGPYSDTVGGTAFSDTFADVAMKYYLNDLRPDLDNFVRPVAGDEAYWQHLNFYAIGLGVIGTLDSTDPAVLQSLTGSSSTSPVRTRSWPSPKSDDQTSIDDMWHATINGRGKLLNAKTSDELNRAISQMMADIGGKEGTQAGVAVSTASLTRDTKKYTPTYTPISWTGNLTAYNLDPTTAVQTGVAWEVEKLVSTDPVTGVKSYTSLIPAAADRNIHVGTGTTTGSRAVPFTYAAMNTAGLLSQMTGTVTTSLIDYLRGDDSNEDVGNDSSGLYRGRQTRLGDIVNSTPVYVKDSVDLRYQDLPSTVPGQSTYASFVAAKRARKEGVIFVGANDGMLHAIRDGTYGTGGEVVDPGGVEVFAYVPNALLPSLDQLASKTYKHRYYVDGPNTETDAYLASQSRWANIVLGTTGAGAGVAASASSSPRTAVYAIDVTSLNTSVEGLDSSKVLWEVSSKQANFAEMGYVLTDIQAGLTLDGTWVAIFGNGYESKSCQASLFIVNMDTGALVKEIKTGVGTCTSAGRNGLGGVRLVKNAQQQVIGVYAGDLQGNMWKFNLNSSSTGSWGLDPNGKPLFKAGATRPITAPPHAVKLPMVGTSKPDVGYMVVFGTGKFFETTDITNTDSQAIFGIWDTKPFGAAATAGVMLTDTSLLVQQTVGTAQRIGGNTFFGITSNAVDYTHATTPKRGWYINLPNSGQRMVYPLDLLAERFIVADTISPSNVSLDPCANSSGGTGYLYIFDAFNGGGPTEPILDTNGDGNVGDGDAVVSGVESKADGRNVTLEVEKNELELISANVSGGDPGSTLIKISCKLTNTCKAAAPGAVKRQWRQLYLR